MNPEIKIITPKDPEYAQMLTLRDEVLRKPLGMSVYKDDLSNEPNELLIVAVERLKVTGCVIIKELDSATGKLRQMAVLPERQGHGTGAKLVAAAEAASLEKGYRLIELNARAGAIAFYERLGYLAEGDVFTEVGIPHLFMKKMLA